METVAGPIADFRKQLLRRSFEFGTNALALKEQCTAGINRPASRDGALGGTRTRRDGRAWRHASGLSTY